MEGGVAGVSAAVADESLPSALPSHPASCTSSQQPHPGPLHLFPEEKIITRTTEPHLQPSCCSAAASHRSAQPSGLQEAWVPTFPLLPSSAPSSSQLFSPSPILHTALQDRRKHSIQPTSHFTGGKTEARSGEQLCLESVRQSSLPPLCRVVEGLTSFPSPRCRSLGSRENMSSPQVCQRPLTSSGCSWAALLPRITRSSFSCRGREAIGPAAPPEPVFWNLHSHPELALLPPSKNFRLQEQLMDQRHWRCLRNTESRAPLQTFLVRSCISTRPPGSSCAQ